MFQKIDLEALANFVEVTLDCHPDYGDDAFAFDFMGQRIYCERKSSSFDLYVGQQCYQLPRC
ncbi:hypothetical protein [Sphingobium bisphenolivorans]|uniref:hypothetical protein n=1 Tax=Sphingobium bisphenolivorans TaxID=1335760 RepID=UPI00039C38F8|nr:hypothetical protein [Sphingobium bisphenolivorans]